MKAGKGYTPWYIGKASKNFKQECLSDQKLLKYNDVLFKGKKGNPVIFLVAPRGDKNKVPTDAIKDMERVLILNAYHANPDLTNVHHTRSVPKWSIYGVIRGGRGKPDVAATAFAKMMGFS